MIAVLVADDGSVRVWRTSASVTFIEWRDSLGVHHATPIKTDEEVRVFKEIEGRND